VITSLAATTASRLVEHAGAVTVVLLAALAVLAAGRPRLVRVRAAAILAVLILTPVLLLASFWNSRQLGPLRHHPSYVAAVLAGALVSMALLALLLRHRPAVLALLVVAALPFRVPISFAGQTSNLLIPLYVVLAAGAVAVSASLLRRGADDSGEPRAGPVEWALMGLVVLYAAQATYASDFSPALKQISFFYVPFALLLVLLRRIRWDRRMLLGGLRVSVGLSAVFVLVGFYEYDRHRLFLNAKLISANQVESYFRVNSLFFDPNIYGRFLALVMLAVTAAMLWGSRRRDVAPAAVVLVLLWGGLMTSVSQSSIAALLLGLAVIAALRWDARRTIRLAALVLLAAGVFLALAGHAIHFNLSNTRQADNTTSGRYTLIVGGLELFAQRPLAGFGSGSFESEFRAHQHSSNANTVAASHAIPITIAAEQGAIGLAAYVLLLTVCFARLFSRGVRGSPARVAVAAAFAALVLHTLLYADFLEDPIAWTLIAIGTALAPSRRAGPSGGPPGARPLPGHRPRARLTLPRGRIVAE